MPNRLTYPLAALLLFIHAAVLWHSAAQKSASVDELSHLASGLFTLSTGDFRMNRTAPPLQNLVNAVPVALLSDYKLEYDNESWKHGIWNGAGDHLVIANPGTFHSILMTGRAGTIFLSMLLGLLVFQWSKELWGVFPAFVVLILTLFEPNLMAHGRLTTTDMAPTLCCLFAGYCFWRFAAKPSNKCVALIGLAFGLAWYSKQSGVVLLPALFLAFLCVPATVPFARKLWKKRLPTVVNHAVRAAALTCAVLITGLAVIWAGYGFEVGDSITESRLPNRSYIWNELRIPIQTVYYFFGIEDRLQFDQADPDQPFWKFLRGWLPAFSHWEGFFANRAHLKSGHFGYFMGESSSLGWKSYYPVLFLIKTPLPLLIMLFTGALLLACRVVTLPREAFAALCWIPLVYAAVIIFFNTANIGYRHALPVVPFLLVLFGGAFAKFAEQCVNHVRRREVEFNKIRFSSPLIPTVITATAVLLLTANTANVLAVHPHYLEYFNGLIGGPKNGHYYAVDSNLDWGQDLFFVKEYVEKNNIPDAHLFYFGPPELPARYGVPCIDARREKELVAGATYIISASYYRGVGAGGYHPIFEPFYQREPDDFITPAMLVYRY